MVCFCCPCVFECVCVFLMTLDAACENYCVMMHVVLYGCCVFGCCLKVPLCGLFVVYCSMLYGLFFVCLFCVCVWLRVAFRVSVSVCFDCDLLCDVVCLVCVCL